MKQFVQVVCLALLFSFLWGLWWGFYSDKKDQPERSPTGVVNVLSLKGYLTEEFLNHLQKNHKLRVNLTEKETELELLRSMVTLSARPTLTQGESYDVVIFPSLITTSFLIENLFLPLDTRKIDNLNDISVDFKRLSFDPNGEYLLPVFWGLNGFVYRKDKVSDPYSLVELLEERRFNRRISFLPSSAEVYHWASTLRPIISTWVGMGSVTELRGVMREIRSEFSDFEKDPIKRLESESLWLAQLESGRATSLLSKEEEFGYFLPKEGATLWVAMAGVSRISQNKALAFEFINNLLNPSLSQKWVEENLQATVLNSLNESSLPQTQKANYIRKVHLSRIKLLLNNEIYEPTWNVTLQNAFPRHFTSTSSSNQED